MEKILSTLLIVKARYIAYRVVTSGVTRGLRQGGGNLVKGRPLAIVWVCDNYFSKTHVRYSTKTENSCQVM